MKKKIVVLLVLVAVVLMLVVINVANRSNDAGITVVQVVPVDGSQILASEKKLDVNVYFENDTSKLFDQVRISDSFGLEWQKQLMESKMVRFSTIFGNEIMAVEEIEMELWMGEDVLRTWTYSVPFDEKAVENIVKAELEEEASFIPSQEDIDYFKEQDEIVNQEQPLWKKLPFETDKFKISHYIEPLRLVVYVKDGEQAEIKTEVEKWIKVNGGNISKHTIEWRK